MGSRDKSYQVLALVALIIGIAGLSVGFAAFSNTLTITSRATVHPNASEFNVDLSGASSSEVTSVTPTVDPTTNGPTGSVAVVDNAGSSSAEINNIHATFTKPGQTVTYTFYARNVGEYLAYLNNITFGEPSGAASGQTKVCIPGTGTTASQVASACNGITLKVSVGSLTDVATSQTGISGHTLSVGGSEQVIVEITYASDAARADGDFDVHFGDVVLTYDSVD